MATITLTGNMMFGGVFNDTRKAFSDAKKSSSNLAKALNSFKSQINAVCAVSDVSTSVEKNNNSIQRETDKSSALSTAYDKLETFLSDVINVDKNVSEKIKELKEDFYNKYKYLKPDYEKSFWDKVKDIAKNIWKGICSIGKAIADCATNLVNWCKEHIAAIIAFVAVILIAVVLALCLGPAAAAAILAMLSFLCDVANLIANAVTGKDVSQLLRESGYPVLADIFDGASAGLTVASVALNIFQLGKEIGKVGLKNFITNGQKGLWNIIKSHLKAFTDGIASDFKAVFGKGLKFKDRLRALVNIVVFDQNADFSFKESISSYRNGDKIIRIGAKSLDITVNRDGEYVPKSEKLINALEKNGMRSDKLMTKNYGRGVDWDWDTYGIPVSDNVDFMKMYNEGRIPIKNGVVDKSRLRSLYWKEAGVKPIKGEVSIHELHDISSGKIQLYLVDKTVHDCLRHNGGVSESVNIMNDIINNKLFDDVKQPIRNKVLNDTINKISDALVIRRKNGYVPMKPVQPKAIYYNIPDFNIPVLPINMIPVFGKFLPGPKRALHILPGCYFKPEMLWQKAFDFYKK